MKMKKRLKGMGVRLCAGWLSVLLLCGGASVSAQETEKKQVAMSYTAKAAYLMEQDTGAVLFEQNATQALAPASLTKLMDLLLIYEAMEEGRLKPDETLTCSAYAKSMGGSEIWLKEGEQMTVEELLKALIVVSANDAAVVFAEAVATTEQAFVEQMNEKGRELGLVNTHFVNATGFDEEGHYTCAQDVAAIARELMTRYGDEITRFSTIWMDSLRGGETELVNTNRLVRFYDGTTGLKTGTTDAAGHCLCATADRNGMSLISVIMGCKTSQDRFEESKQLLDYGFTNFLRYQPEMPQQTEPVPVVRGEETQVEGYLERMPQAVIRRDESEQMQVKTEYLPQLEAPIQKGQTIGRILLVRDGTTLAEEPIRAARDIAELTFRTSMGHLFRGLVSMAG